MAAQVFISYKRGAQPDEPLALRLHDALGTEGRNVFLDTQTLRVGERWAARIEEEIRSSDYMIVILSEASSSSEMVLGEVEIARDQAAQTGGRPVVLPLRAGFAGALPYPLSSYLDGIQYVMWRGENDTARILSEVAQAVAGGHPPASGGSLQPFAPSPGSAPSYAAALRPPGGDLPIEDPRYIVRDSDRRAMALVRRRGPQGETIVIRGPRQMGKSSLLVRVISAALEAEKRAVLLDFQLLDQSAKSCASRFFREFLRCITEQLELRDAVDSEWDEGISSPSNCTRYFETHILKMLGAPLLLALDEADLISSCPFGQDFFAMLRVWHNRRADPIRRSWKLLDLAMVISTEPHLLIPSLEQSPFNVGETLRLSEFTHEQVRELNALHGSPLFPEEADRFYRLLAGHPYLTRRALYEVANDNLRISPEELVDRAFQDSDPFGDHLRRYLLLLQGHPDLIRALREIVNDRPCADETLCHRLEAAGLVRREGGRAAPRCPLYAGYFKERLHGID